MTLGGLATIAIAIAMILAGLWLLVRNRAAGEWFAGLERDEYRYSLLNAERVERIRDSVDDPASRVLDRGKAIFAGSGLVVMGVALLVPQLT